MSEDQGGVSRSEVESAIRSAINNLESRINDKIRDLQREINELSNQLDSLIRTLNNNMSSLGDSIRQVNASVGETTRAVSQVSTGVADLKSQTVQQLQQVTQTTRDGLHQVSETTQQGLAQVTTTTKSGLETVRSATEQGLTAVERETKAGTTQIANRVDYGTEVTHGGLKKVSSGVALVEVLQGKFAAGESELTIKNSVGRIEQRHEQALKNLEKVHELYDDHFQRILNSFTENLKRISAHIQQLKYEQFGDLNKRHINYSEDSWFHDNMLDAEQKRSDSRAEIINEVYGRLDLEELKKFYKLYEEIINFIYDQSLIAVSVPAMNQFIALASSLFYLPVTVVVDSDSKTEAFALETVSAKGEKPHAHQDELKHFRERATSVKAGLDPKSGRELSKTENEEMITSFGRLKHAGLLTPDEHDLLVQHLMTYRLKLYAAN